VRALLADSDFHFADLLFDKVAPRFLGERNLFKTRARFAASKSTSLLKERQLCFDTGAALNACHLRLEFDRNVE